MTGITETIVVPRKLTKEMKQRVLEIGGAQALAYGIAAWDTFLEAAPAPPAPEPAVWQHKHDTLGWRDIDPDDMELFRAMGKPIRALYAAPPAAVAASPEAKPAPAVKALEWEKHGEAKGCGAKYAVYGTSHGWNAVCYPFEEPHFRLAEGMSEASAQAAAQSDYDRRVRACLVGGEAGRRDVWVAAARSMLEAYEGPVPGCTYDRTERADKDHVIHAGCAAAEAYEFGTVDRDHATSSLIRAFLISLLDITDPRLDYLKAEAPCPPATGVE